MCLHAFQLISISPALLVSEWLQTATLVVFPLSGRADRPLSDLACERCWSEGTILTWQTPSDETHTEPRQEKCSPIPRGCSADGGLWKRDVKKHIAHPDLATILLLVPVWSGMSYSHWTDAPNVAIYSFLMIASVRAQWIMEKVAGYSFLRYQGVFHRRRGCTV